jgi:hypothetical protein
LTAPALDSELIECLALAIARYPAGQSLPTPDRCINVPRVELDAVTAPAGALGGDNRRSIAHEGIEHDVARCSAI